MATVGHTLVPGLGITLLWYSYNATLFTLSLSFHFLFICFRAKVKRRQSHRMVLDSQKANRHLLESAIHLWYPRTLCLHKMKHLVVAMFWTNSNSLNCLGLPCLGRATCKLLTARQLPGNMPTKGLAVVQNQLYGTCGHR